MPKKKKAMGKDDLFSDDDDGSNKLYFKLLYHFSELRNFQIYFHILVVSGYARSVKADGGKHESNVFVM